ncbi:DUF4129 domain-containing protein [Paenibacillus mesophilus]|uniref:DUF4129 domain-containing protein n=1 Tax=Paenibacillus mesophilus TaxID=2582849 RepID=UPI00110D78CE|nr:DUF4129 domain-containing protein [Paenibacillus mesophilus]TMV50837.1 DUF4129 domain-containing protein [Paenibacillus mesophilus]
MKHGKAIVFACLQGLAELLLYFPILVALYITVRHPALEFPLWLALWSGLYTLGYSFHYAFPGVRQWQALLMALAVPGLFAYLADGPALGFVLNYALWALAWIRGRQNRLWGWDSSFPSGLMIICMVGYFIASFLFPYFLVTWHYAPWVTGLGIPALALTLYRGNSSTLDSESSQGTNDEKKPIVGFETRWRNRALVLAVFALIVLIASIRTIAGAAKQAASFLFHGTIDLLRKLLGLFVSETAESTPPPKEPFTDDLLAQGEPSAFALLMEKVIYWVGVVLLLAVTLGALYVVGTLTKRWLRRFMGWYGERLEATPEAGYVDEKQSLLDAREWALDRARQLKQRIDDFFRKEPGWDDFADNRERIRQAYRRLLLGRIAGGYGHDVTRTPRETSEEMGRQAPLGEGETALIRLYEEARYGSEDVSDERAVQAKALFRSGEGGRK